MGREEAWTHYNTVKNFRISNWARVSSTRLEVRNNPTHVGEVLSRIRVQPMLNFRSKEHLVASWSYAEAILPVQRGSNQSINQSITCWSYEPENGGVMIFIMFSVHKTGWLLKNCPDGVQRNCQRSVQPKNERRRRGLTERSLADTILTLKFKIHNILTLRDCSGASNSIWREGP